MIVKYLLHRSQKSSHHHHYDDQHPQAGRAGSNCRASPPSWPLAAWTRQARIRPCTSGRIWRLRPLTYLPPSRPRCSKMRGASRTLWVSRQTSEGGGRPTSRQAVGLVDGIGQGLPQPVALPAPKIVVHRRPRCRATGQTAPLTAGAAAIAHRIND